MGLILKVIKPPNPQIKRFIFVFQQEYKLSTQLHIVNCLKQVSQNLHLYVMRLVSISNA